MLVGFLFKENFGVSYDPTLCPTVKLHFKIFLDYLAL